MLFTTRKSFVTVAAILVAGIACGVTLSTHSISRAAAPMAGGNMPMAGSTMPMAGGNMMAGDDHAQSMGLAHMDQMKQMAADPKMVDAMAHEMAKMMVMDQMAKTMAKDPKFQQASMAASKAPNMMQVHDQAMKMASDPEQMKKLQAEVMADAAAMKTVTYQATQIIGLQGR